MPVASTEVVSIEVLLAGVAARSPGAEAAGAEVALVGGLQVRVVAAGDGVRRLSQLAWDSGSRARPLGTLVGVGIRAGVGIKVGDRAPVMPLGTVAAVRSGVESGPVEDGVLRL